VLVAAVFAQVLQRALGLPVEFAGRVLGFIAVGSIVFAALGSLYPVILGVRLSPVEAMRSV
jgi:ABC-type lipoprotein release transport system permease subunit